MPGCAGPPTHPGTHHRNQQVSTPACLIPAGKCTPMWHSPQETASSDIQAVRPGRKRGERRSVVAALPFLPRGVRRTPLPNLGGCGARGRPVEQVGRPRNSGVTDHLPIADEAGAALLAGRRPVLVFSVMAHARRVAAIRWSTRLQGAGAGGWARPVAEAWVEGTRTNGYRYIGAICRAGSSVSAAGRGSRAVDTDQGVSAREGGAGATWG